MEGAWHLYDGYLSGEIYVGGNFFNEDHSIRGLAKWDGEQWVSPGPPLVGSFSWVRKMLVYQDELYIAGIFSKADLFLSMESQLNI